MTGVGLNKRTTLWLKARKRAKEAQYAAQFKGLSLDALLSGDVLIPANKVEPPADAGHFAGYSTFCGTTRALSLTADVRELVAPFYFVSNNDDALRKAEGLGWLPLYLNLPVSKDPVLAATQAKIAKAYPQAFAVLNRYAHLLYFDDKKHHAPAQANAALERFASRSDVAVAVPRHPFLGGGILQEFSQAMAQPRYRSQRFKMSGFITTQLEAGHKVSDVEMYWTAYIYRNMRHPDCEPISRAWYSAIGECGIECQVSFDFVAQRFESIEAYDLEDIFKL